MGRTVRELLDGMTSRELSEWMAYYSIEPFGERREDMRAAQICAILANIHRGEDTPPFSVDDFMPDFQRQPTKQDTVSRLQRLHHELKEQM